MTADPCHLAIFLPSLRGGGAERVMLHVARGFAERGARVDMVLGRAGGPFCREVPAGVNLVDLGAPRALACLPALVRYLRTQRPQTLLSALNNANCLAVLARRCARTPVRLVISVHNALSHAATNSPRLRGRLMPALARHLFPGAEKIITVSRGVADDLTRCCGIASEQMQVIYNPVVTPELFHLMRDPAPHPWFTAGIPPVVLGVGRLTAQKDFPTLIRAFSEVHRQMPCRLIIIGEGEERGRLETLVRDLGLREAVDLPGFVENPYSWMARASVFVLSSAWEGFGNVLVEALTAGAPVIATDCESGPREILEDGKFGTLCPVGDAPALAAAMRQVLADPAAYTPAAFPWERFALPRVLDAYAQVLFPEAIPLLRHTTP